jgi:hypothetical protein
MREGGQLRYFISPISAHNFHMVHVVLGFCCNHDQILYMSYMLSFVRSKLLSPSMPYFYKMWSFAISEVDNNSLVIRVIEFFIK